MKPRVAFKVDNTLTGDATKLAVELRFKSLDDFGPEQVARQVEPLRKLVEARRRLSDLLGKLDGNDKLDELLQEVIASTDTLQQLGKETGIKDASAGTPAE
jgi:type VI secretion system protein ImpB